MKPCVLIPCYNHSVTVGAVARAALEHCPVIVVDDGSTMPLPEMPGCTLVRLERNGGKAAALRVGFQRAMELGFTHAITMDADGQHFGEDLPKFLTMAQAQPEAYLVGVRDLVAAGCPRHRQRSNRISTFWYRVETGVRLSDTQCGFRCYPLQLVNRLRIKSGRYAYELEFMVRAAWIDTRIVPVPVKCTYAPGQTGVSHFRTVRDFVHITHMNILLVLQSWFVPRPLRVAWSQGQRWGFGRATREFFAEHAHDPWHMSLAVGLGLFFGIVPIWGFQMVAAAAAAHWLRLNKAIALVASNISIPPIAPFIVGGGFILGHWLFTGEVMPLSLPDMTHSKALEYVWEWLVGSIALAIVVGGLGTFLTFVTAKLFWRR
ncbi:MAG TPA: DUF2062 domain-containing protein [Verrucomicrobiae bacterium]|nr:DUF2062 domain-containing protein [Verrucomicrobiae bacterium]